MDFLQRVFGCVLAAAAVLALSGCTPPATSAADDEQEPNYVLGQSRVNALDYPGAVDAFEESLAVNPRSAAAHFQLAMLYDEKETNAAAAIYHYQQYLKFDPKAGNAAVINQRIYTCKQQLAANVFPLPSTPAMQQQFQQLLETNRFLSQQLAVYVRLLAAAKTNASLPPDNFIPPPNNAPVLNHPPVMNPRTSAVKPRTHLVLARETLAAIARKYNVSLNALLAANPGLNPKKLRVGQTINLPAS